LEPDLVVKAVWIDELSPFSTEKVWVCKET
jgi:hypothetical protein